MTDTLQFLQPNLIVPTIIGAALLFLAAVWKEWNLPLKFKFYLNVSVSAIAILALSMLILKPAYWSSTETSSGVLLTNGYEIEALDSLKKQHSGLKVIPYQSNRPIGEILDSISPLFIIGQGVQPFDFWQFENKKVNYLEAKLPRGITRLKYTKKLLVGDSLLIRGEYHEPSTKNKLFLAYAGGKEFDSVLLRDSDKTDFELSAELKVVGTLLYELREKDSVGKLLSVEPLPVQVIPRKKMKIMMVNGFPTFESKYVKNFLAEAGHEVIVRNQLSRGKYKFEYFNTERQPFYSFTDKFMQSIDLMIIDANSYRNLSKKYVQVIEQAIEEYGLGLFVLPDTGFFQLPSNIPNFEFYSGKETKTSWSRWPNLSLDKFPYHFKTAVRLEQINKSKEGILTAYVRKGRGRIGTTLVENTYQLLLKGNIPAHRQFWTNITSVLGKRHVGPITWHSDTTFPLKDEPFLFELRTSDGIPAVFGENGKIPMRQNPDIQELWYGTTYPRKTGWQQIRLSQDTVEILRYYVIDSTAWKSLKAAKTITENKVRFKHIEEPTETTKTLKPIEPLWYFLLFMASMGYLWLVPKLSSDP